ncbi:MAG: hypothetical protein AB7P02_24865 [Alphaproteobacteria bacterium]
MTALFVPVQALAARILLATASVALFVAPAAAFSGSEELAALNGAARAAYAAGRGELSARRGPVIVVGADIALLANGAETRASYTPDLYTKLKSVSHVALGAVGLLQAYADDAAGSADKWRPHLEVLRERARAAEAVVDTLGLDADATARSRLIFARMGAFMDGVLARGSFTGEELTAAARTVAPALLAHADEAARAQIDALHAVVGGWRARMSAEDWANLRVIVLGPRMPRAGYVQFAYFRFAMGEEAVDRRLIYGENIWDDKGALALLGTILADRSVGRIAFDDEMRMDRDMMADGAHAYLLRLFGKLGAPRP